MGNPMPEVDFIPQSATLDLAFVVWPVLSTTCLVESCPFRRVRSTAAYAAPVAEFIDPVRELKPALKGQ